jgi:phosphate transport system substrate-binding protein
MKKTLFLLSFLLIFLVSCKGKEEKKAGFTKTISGAGATFPYPLYSTWAGAYYKETGIKVNYQSIGSGGGIRQITERTVDFGASDMALKPEEVEEKRLLQFPAVIGGVVVAVNLPEAGEKKLILDGEALCKIYLGEIKNWNDAKLKALNTGLTLPDKPITPVYRSDGSGTTAIFTHYLSDVCKKWEKEVGFGTSVSFKTGLGAKGNEGVANYVKRTPYSLGYVEYAYAVQNKMQVADMMNAKGKVVSPSVEAFKEAGKTAELKPEKLFFTWMTNAPGEGAWPIAGATYILLAQEKAETNKEIVKFFDWAFQKGDSMALQLHYVPLSDEVKAKIRDYWKSKGLY